MLNKCDEPAVRQTRVIAPVHRSVSGVYAFRDITPIAFESTLERDFLIRMEFSLSVSAVVAQPAQVPFTDSRGRSRSYTPDFLVYFRQEEQSLRNYPKPELIEIKLASEWQQHWRRWLPKWKAARRYAQDRGWVFHIVDESRIRDGVLDNIRFLERYKNRQFPEEESRWVLDNVAALGSASFDYVVARHFMGIYRAEGIAHVWHLLATQRLVCDMSRMRDPFNELWVP